MFNSIMTSRSGMNANQDRLDAISNNLANSSTPGYKKIEVGFKDLLSESLDRQGYPIYDKNASMGTGVKTTNWFRDNTQGSLSETGLETDMMIEGKGYFKLTDTDGKDVYTRDGGFQIDKNQQLVDKEGRRVEINYVDGRSSDNVKFEKDNLNIDTSGNISIIENGAYTKVAQIPMYTAVGDQSFKSIGDNLFVPADGAQVQQTTTSLVHQGYLERSNVDMASEFTDMIVTQRAFQLSSKGLQTSDEMWGMVNNLRK